LLLKQLFHRLRPPDTRLESFSFPSGHAMTAVVTYGMLGVLIARAAPRRRPVVALAGIWFALLIGASRVYLGLHWASDVVAGFAAGGLLLAISTWATSPGFDPGGHGRLSRVPLARVLLLMLLIPASAGAQAEHVPQAAPPATQAAPPAAEPVPPAAQGSPPAPEPVLPAIEASSQATELFAAPPARPPANHASALATPARGFLFHPDGPGLWKSRLGVGAQIDMLPRRVVQSAGREVPQITGILRVGLPVGFSADLRAAAILINNQLELGVAWSTHAGPVALSVHDHQGFWFGLVGLQGFDSSGWGWINKPGFTAGMAMGSVRFSATFELIYTFGQHVRLGQDNIARGALLFAGESLGFTVENLLPRGGLWYFGVGLLRTSPNYEAWLAFSDERSRLPYPRFFGGYAF
jgi:hypothetical protein